MAKKRSKAFWGIFFSVSAVFLIGWFFFWQIKAGNFAALRGLLGLLPVETETKTDLDTLITLGEAVYYTGGEERTYLILFQNNYELRPGGGFIGSFGILTLKDGELLNLEVHDTINFDGRIPDTVDAPFPMEETLGVWSWKFRDSNFAPDWKENAKQAEEFYRLGGGTEEIDGVVGITASVLESFLRVTGPVTVPGYPGTYGADNAVLDLEYQVEQAYYKQGITFGERKSIMGLMAAEVLKKTKALPIEKQYELFRILLTDLHTKDIQLYFEDPELQRQVVSAGWDGSFDGQSGGDYLYVVDSNMNAFKSDYYLERSYAYRVDFSRGVPLAELRVTYRHTAKEANYLTKDYQTYTRVYAPKGSFLEEVQNAHSMPTTYGEYQNRKFFGNLIQVPLGTEKTVVYRYRLPESVSADHYRLTLQKQPGMKPVPVSVEVIGLNGLSQKKSVTLERDQVMEF